MTNQRAIDILQTEKECVERAGTATQNKGCDRNCADCDLVLQDAEILEAYTIAIELLEKRERSGQWINSCWEDTKVCSLCGWEQEANNLTNYCPSCGARMEERP